MRKYEEVWGSLILNISLNISFTLSKDSLICMCSSSWLRLPLLILHEGIVVLFVQRCLVGMLWTFMSGLTGLTAIQARSWQQYEPGCHVGDFFAEASELMFAPLKTTSSTPDWRYNLLATCTSMFWLPACKKMQDHVSFLMWPDQLSQISFLMWPALLSRESQLEQSYAPAWIQSWNFLCGWLSS